MYADFEYFLVQEIQTLFNLKLRVLFDVFEFILIFFYFFSTLVIPFTNNTTPYWSVSANKRVIYRCLRPINLFSHNLAAENLTIWLTK